VTHRWPQILPGGEAVLFTSSAIAQDYENGSIQVLSLKSGKWKTVQRGGYLGRYLPTSSDAGHLVYIHEGTLLAVPFDLNRMETQGSAVPLVEDVATIPINGSGQVDFSRNGTFIYGSATSQDVVLASIESNGRTQPLLPSGPYAYPRLSPDGTRLALQLAGDVQVYDLEHNRATRLTFTHRSEAEVWAPDRKHLAFNTSTGTGSFWIQWMRVAGASEAQTLLESKATPVGFSFSPDGSRLAFSYSTTSSPGATADIWILPLDMTDPEHPRPGQPELFARRPGTSTGLSFSPDGKWIAYVSNESGRAEIYVRPFPAPTDGSAGGKWQISSDGGFIAPVWSRDGKELFFDSLDGHIMVAAYRVSGQMFDADKPRLWSNVPALVFGSLDSQHLAATVVPGATEQGNSVHLTVLLNFFDEIRRRAPGGK
jgi:serine/threonine-protein kinase